MIKNSRRQFLTDSLLTAAAGLASSTLTLSAEEPTMSNSPQEKLGVALIGAGGRSLAHIEAFATRPDTEVLWVVDADRSRAEAKAIEVAKRQKRTPKVAEDMRTAFEDRSVDFVSTATPNHWHALVSVWAMQHGKDVYVEKPVSHNVQEGRSIVAAARKYQRICQVGTQSRSMSATQDAIKFLHDGKLGFVQVARGLCYKPRKSIGPRGEYPAPTDVNYDLWLGPAPLAPVTRSRFHYDWHWQWPYGNGDLGNQGIHEMDVARWGLGVSTLSHAVFSYGGRFGYDDAGETANTQVVIHDFGKQKLTFEVRGLKTDDYQGAKIGVVFECSDGYLAMDTPQHGVAFDREGNVIREFSGDGDHFGNFITAVRSRNASDLNADILEGHLSSALCHLGNISYRTGQLLSIYEFGDRAKTLENANLVRESFDRTCQHLADNGIELAKTKIKLGSYLEIDPAAEAFIDNEAANKYLTRDYRTPFVVPNAKQV